MRLKVWGLAAAGLAAIATGFVALLLQDAIARALLMPRTPFQVSAPPPAPDYEDPTRSAWLLWPAAETQGIADIFYVHSTTYYSRRGWNGSTADASIDMELKRLAAPNEAGPFVETGRLYGPRYRQATLFAQFTHKFDGVAARRLAYADVRRAFETFLRDSDARRPIILVGYEQGGLHALGLLRNYFQEPRIASRLAVAYVIGQPVPLADFSGPLKATPPCAEARSVRCIVSYVDVEARFPREIDRARRRAMAWDARGDLVATEGRPALCINPLSWTATEKRQPRELQAGAASATGLPFGQTPPRVADAVGAQCVGGVLKVDRPDQDYLRRRDWLASKWRAQHFNLFYFDLAENAATRAAAAAALMAEEAKRLAPIEDSVDIVVSPINKTRY